MTPEGPSVSLRNNRYLERELMEIHESQQESLQRQEDRRLETKSRRDARNRESTVYNGLDENCAICTDTFDRGDWCYRVLCNHVFHKDCWLRGMQANSQDQSCPNCRGPGHVKAEFRHMGVDNAEEAARNMNAASSDVHGNVHSAEPQRQRQPLYNPFINEWPDTPWRQHPVPEDGRQAEVLLTAAQLAEWSSSWSMDDPEEYFQKRSAEAAEAVHLKQASKTKLPGRLSFLVDLGSRINVIGSDTDQEFKQAINDAGRKVTRKSRESVLNVNGVGKGSAQCYEKATYEVAVKYADKGAQLDEFTANIATGSGSSLPAIYGSESMQDKDAVIILRRGQEIIAFPGEGGYKIQWSPGTKLCPMTPAPSGHLVVQCDRFDDIRNDTDRAMT